ncbi:MAG: phosphate-starvation-inducible PsiE family protein [Desulfosudis oleivorans]|nr:phosphate-starvation-inducible PsiE family protein [Desulfosudis oleivorans]
MRNGKADLLETLNKALDLNLDILTSSYREAELKKVFLSYKVESVMIQWSERLMHGLNLLLLIGLMALAIGVVSLLGSDVYYALTTDLQNGVIKALGSLLILWMMIELLHTQVDVLRGGKFHVRIFLELALVAFIRKLFVASVEAKDSYFFRPSPGRSGSFRRDPLSVGKDRILGEIEENQELENNLRRSAAFASPSLNLLICLFQSLVHLLRYFPINWRSKIVDLGMIKQSLHSSIPKGPQRLDEQPQG